MAALELLEELDALSAHRRSLGPCPFGTRIGSILAWRWGVLGLNISVGDHGLQQTAALIEQEKRRRNPYVIGSGAKFG